jgi:hypothetical protein
MKAATVEAATVKTAKCSMEAASAPGVKSTTSSAVEPAAPTAVKPAAASATPSGDRRDVRHDAERANRNARRENSYHFLVHGVHQ